MHKNKTAVTFRALVDQMKDTLPVVTYLREEALKDSHKAEIKALLDRPIDLDQEDLTLQTLIDMNVKDKKD
jgi:hypothetical protein